MRYPIKSNNKRKKLQEFERFYERRYRNFIAKSRRMVRIVFREVNVLLTKKGMRNEKD